MVKENKHISRSYKITTILIRINQRVLTALYLYYDIK